ncbi:MAG: aminotransferase class III-fold pyridoxal phosphate-dependent enzyme, partial [Acidimicrobiales bacterium]
MSDTTTTTSGASDGTDDTAATEADRALQQTARDHMWLHFSRMGVYDDEHRIPVIERGEGAYVYDSRGKRYLDGLSGLFVVQLGHGRRDLAEAAMRQAETLA